MPSADIARYEQISLDQYIQENHVQDQVCMLKKKKRMDSEEEKSLREQLDLQMDTRKKRSSGRSKFDRSIDLDSDEEEEYENRSTITMKSDDDVEMTDLNSSKTYFHQIEEINRTDDIDSTKLCQIKRPFRTIESNMGLRIESQGWRLERQNAIGMRPQNMPYLTPRSRSNSLMSKAAVNNGRVQRGRIGKPNKQKPKTIQNGSLFLTYENENTDKVTNIETRGKRLRIEAPEAVFAVPLPPGPLPRPDLQYQEKQMTDNSSNVMILKFLETIKGFADTMLRQQQPATTSSYNQIPTYNVPNELPVQEPKVKENSYLEYLNHKHNIEPQNRKLVQYGDISTGFGGLPSSVIPNRYS